MKFQLNSPHLIITAETGRNIAELCAHFRMPIENHTDELIAGTMTYTASGDKRPWFEITATVPFDFLKPYYDRLQQITGYDGAPFALSDWRLKYGRTCNNLCHTHIVDDAIIDDRGLTAHGFIQSQDWNGKTAAERAPTHFAEYLRDGIGITKSEPQYIRLDNNLLKENPAYGRVSHKPEPGLASERLFEAVFNYWVIHLASDAQRALFEQAETCYRTVVKTSSLPAGLMETVSSFHIDNYETTVTFDQFKEMGNV